jgi:prepilin-type N-terminal cleavage/methylation domain-containing protein
MAAILKRRHQGEEGYTLTEVLVALTILAVSVVAIVGAMSSTIFASRVHRSIVTGDTAVRAYAAQIQQAAYVPCAGTTGPNQYPIMQDMPGGVTVTIAKIQYWNGATPAAYGASCTTDQGVQRITILAQPQANAGKQTLVVLKRAP